MQYYFRYLGIIVSKHKLVEILDGDGSSIRESRQQEAKRGIDDIFYIAQPLVHTINSAVSTSIFPDSLNTAKVIPCSKKAETIP